MDRSKTLTQGKKVKSGVPTKNSKPKQSKKLPPRKRDRQGFMEVGKQFKRFMQ